MDSNRHKELTSEQAEKLLKIRDALAEGDVNEAYHWLYLIADPAVEHDADHVWSDLEELAGRPNSRINKKEN